MTNPTPHMPLPWHVDLNRYDGEYRVYTADGVPVINSLFKGKEAKGDAELIVRACNSHEALVEACQTLLNAYDEQVTPSVMEWRAIEAALKLARGEP